MNSIYPNKMQIEMFACAHKITLQEAKRIVLKRNLVNSIQNANSFNALRETLLWLVEKVIELEERHEKEN